jgi:alkanesulfonate monooxygenase
MHSLEAVQTNAEFAPPGRAPRNLKVFSTCAQSLNADPREYLKHVTQVAQWSERAGCEGMLVYTDNSIADAWLVSQMVIASTASLCPLVAVQPVYLHPYSAAKMVTSLAFLHGRKVYLNMVAGGFMNDLKALNDLTPHDRRYDRLIEYTTIVTRLLADTGPVTFAGDFYTLDKLTLQPCLPDHLMPEVFVSGSSEAGINAAAATGATVIQYPPPPGECMPPAASCKAHGLRIGIIARTQGETAWTIARERFPSDRKGKLTHQLAMKVSDSSWHKALSGLADDDAGSGAYWLGPFEYSKSNCPYLVGSYEVVAQELARYLAVSYTTFILDIPPVEEELEHTGIVFALARQIAGEVR